MPRLAEGIFAAHYDSAVKLAARPGGVSRPDLIKNLNISRVIADKIIEKAGLVVGAKDGRTEFFVPPDGGAAPLAPAVEVTPITTSTEGLVGVVVTSPPPPVVVPAPVKGKGGRPKKAKAEEPAAAPPPAPAQVAATPAPVAAPTTETPVEEEEDTGAQIAETRKLLADACQKAGRAMGEWATHQAMADALQEKLKNLVAKMIS
jgi:hypothetical protein